MAQNDVKNSLNDGGMKNIFFDFLLFKKSKNCPFGCFSNLFLSKSFSNLLTFLRYHVEFGTWPRWFLYAVTSIFLLGHVDFSTKPRWFFYVHLYHKWSEKYSVIITKQCLQTCLSEILPIIVSAITKNHAHMVLKRVYYEWFFYTSDKKCTQMLTNVLTSA